MASDPPRSAAVWTLLVLLVVQGVGAVGGGIALVAAPDGGVLHMPVENLHGSPFHDFLVPGIVLLVVLGVWPLAAAAGLWRHRAWAWYSAFAIGCGLMIFEVVEVLSIPFSPLQSIYFVVGLALAALALLPSVRRSAGLRPLGRSSGAPRGAGG